MTPTTKAQIEAVLQGCEIYLRAQKVQDDYGQTPGKRLLTSVGEALTALSSIEAGGGWLPIESAPRDGIRVLLGRTETWVAPARFNRGVWRADSVGVLDFPTHWQPLPPPPRKAEEVGG